MQYAVSDVNDHDRYKILTAFVLPRPIAWVTTVGPTGTVNAAPFSFFNVMGSAPPTVALGILADPERGFKDTARNILDTEEFVVNLVPERLVGQMNVTAVDAPRGVDELALADLATSPSSRIRPPRIAESPVNFECVLLSSVQTGPAQLVAIGRVLVVHIDDDYLLDVERAYVDTPKLDLVARSYGSGYVRSRDTFNIERPKWSDWVAEGRVK